MSGNDGSAGDRDGVVAGGDARQELCVSQHQTRQPAALEEPLLQSFAEQHGERGMQADEAARLMSFLVQTQSARQSCVLLPPRTPESEPGSDDRGR